MRQFSKVMVCEVRDEFEMWVIAAGVVVGTFIALAI
jgi:hypothetical protein